MYTHTGTHQTQGSLVAVDGGKRLRGSVFYPWTPVSNASLSIQPSGTKLPVPEDMQTCFHLTKDEDPHMEKFYARSPNTLYFDVIVFQSRNRGGGGGGAFLRKAFKG